MLLITTVLALWLILEKNQQRESKLTEEHTKANTTLTKVGFPRIQKQTQFGPLSHRQICTVCFVVTLVAENKANTARLLSLNYSNASCD